MTDAIYGKIQTAREKGVSDEAIRKFLMDHPLVEEARKKGVSDDKIFAHLGLPPAEPTALETVGNELDYIAGQIPEDLMAIGQSFTPTELSRTINRVVMSPKQSAMEAVSGISEFLQHPYESFRERPISTALNVAPFGMAAGKVAGAARRFAAPVLEPQRAAVQNVMSKLSQPQEFANAMAQPITPVPGAPPVTASQAAVQAGLSEPAVAGLEAGLKNVTQPYGREVFALEEQRLSAIQQQIRNIDADLQERAASMSPDEVARLKTVRDDLLRQVAEQRQALTARGQALPEQLPLTSIREQGVRIQRTAQDIEKDLRTRVIQPAYAEPIKEAGNAKIDITPVVALSEQVLGAPLRAYKPEAVPSELGSALASLRRPPSRGDWVSLGERGGYYGEEGAPAPTTATLKQIDAIRQGLNADLAEAATASKEDRGAATRYRALKEMKSRLDQAISNTEAIPEHVKEAYAKANALYAEEFAPRVKQGITGDMLQNTARGVTKLLPDDIVDAVLKNETNAQQFVRTFEANPTARNALEAGIIDRVRRAAQDIKTGFIDPTKIAEFAQNPALSSLGIDLQATLQPLVAEANEVNTGLAELKARASKFKKADASDLVKQALKNTMEMRYLMDNIGPNGKAALRKDLTDQALGMIRAEKPAKVLKYLDKHAKPLEMAIGKDTVENIRGLADAQTVLKQIEKTAPEPKKKVAVALDGYTKEQLTDIKSLIDEINRVEEVARLSSVRPTASTADLAAQEGVSGAQLPQIMSRAVTFTKSAIDKISEFATRRMQVETARLLIKDRELLGQLVNEALTKKEKPPRIQMRTVAGAAALNSPERVKENPAPIPSYLQPTNAYGFADNNKLLKMLGY
jgi:hypothetical protein